MFRLLAVLVSLFAGMDGGAFQTALQARPAALPATLRLYVMDCGTLHIADTRRFRLEPGEVAVSDLSVPCFLIAHPKGTMIWDAGAIPDADWKPSGAATPYHLKLPDGSERRLTLRKPLLAQLAAAGYSPKDVMYLALSHYHYDHTANANSFAGATWLVRKEERDLMFGTNPVATTRPETYSSLRTSKAMILENDEHDVFGDGSVVIKAAPGHTPGHQVLVLKLAKTGMVLLSGDLYHYPEARRLQRVTTFDFDQQRTVATRERIEAFLKKTGAALWIEHDSAGNAKLRKAPAFYE